MDIAAMSIGLSQMNLAQEISTSVMKMAMDTAKTQTSDLTKMMEHATAPHLGSSVDISL